MLNELRKVRLISSSRQKSTRDLDFTLNANTLIYWIPTYIKRILGIILLTQLQMDYL